MTPIDYQLEQFYKRVAERPRRKDEDTITSFNRDIFWYDRDERYRQRDGTSNTTSFNYEEHRKAIETAVNIFRKTTVHDIAMTILTNRYFANYRNSVFAGNGNFNKDYSFLVRKASMLFNSTAGRINNINITDKLKNYDKPTLVQINHITGDVTKVLLPKTSETLNEWAIKFNRNANESTTYHIAGLKVGNTTTQKEERNA